MPIPAPDRTRPRQSTGGVAGSREVGTAATTPTATTAASRAISTKMLPHQKRSSSQPPAIGPTATPAPAQAPHSPIARARSRRPVNTLMISDSVDG